jgi:hypothetical protein
LWLLQVIHFHTFVIYSESSWVLQYNCWSVPTLTHTLTQNPNWPNRVLPMLHYPHNWKAWHLNCRNWNRHWRTPNCNWKRLNLNCVMPRTRRKNANLDSEKSKHPSSPW